MNLLLALVPVTAQRATSTLDIRPISFLLFFEGPSRLCESRRLRWERASEQAHLPADSCTLRSSNPEMRTWLIPRKAGGGGAREREQEESERRERERERESQRESERERQRVWPKETPKSGRQTRRREMNKGKREKALFKMKAILAQVWVRKPEPYFPRHTPVMNSARAILT